MEVRYYKLLPLLLFIFLGKLLLSQVHPDDVVQRNMWVDSVYQSLSLDKKIGQLFFVRANYPTGGYFTSVDTLIRDYNIGGVVFFKGNPVDQALQTNRWNALAKTPLFISIDAEWGLGMRLSDVVSYPLQMTLGALTNNHLIYEMGKQVAEQCRRLGIHLNFAPVVDVNSNPLNPVIGMRSFGEDPAKVAQKADYYMRGMQDGGLIACAKHFPGHGNTFMDSHADLPVISSPLSTLRDNDLLPFSYLVDRGVESVMIAHLSVPALDDRPNVPATLSKPIVTDWLKDSLGFQGLIITDGLDMKGVTKYHQIGEVSLKALEAGNDILLIPDDVPASIQKIKDAILVQPLLMNRVEESCKKILAAKYALGLPKQHPIEVDDLMADLNQSNYSLTVSQMMDEAVTLVKEEIKLPLSIKSKMALLITGTTQSTPFEEKLLETGKFDVFHILHDASSRTRKKLLQSLRKYSVVVVGVLNTNILASKRFGIPDEEVRMLETLAVQNQVVIDMFASPYALNFFPNLQRFSSILVSYQEKPSMQVVSAEKLIKSSTVWGVLPVSVAGYPKGWGLNAFFSSLYRASPQEVMANQQILDKVDSLAVLGLRSGAYPGCQILAAKDGAIFYQKSFGFHTYDSITPVQNSDIYDLASLTKILATTPALMRFTEDSLIDIHNCISDYLLLLKNTNKDSITFMEALAHQSGLRNWIPFYLNTLNEDGPDSEIYQVTISEEFPTRVAENLYVRKGYEHVLIDSIVHSPLREKKYSYSGLAFYLFKILTEQLTNSEFDDFVYENWYDPLQLMKLRFNPRNYFDLSEVIPTENDSVFRTQLLHGDVHDQGAALIGGVSGNAGLFGNSHDVAVMMQMFLNEGNYGGYTFFDPETVIFFTDYHFVADSNRRGLGFDKPLLVYEDHMTNCKDASPESFGHSGFTGTYAWADPKNGLLYVFLSNRVYPNASNTLLMDMDIRTDIHQLFYESLKK